MQNESVTQNDINNVDNDDRNRNDNNGNNYNADSNTNNKIVSMIRKTYYKGFLWNYI